MSRPRHPGKPSHPAELGRLWRARRQAARRLAEGDRAALLAAAVDLIQARAAAAPLLARVAARLERRRSGRGATRAYARAGGLPAAAFKGDPR
ncbi:hypothetical protein [Roseospirillum parvum]|uniref:Uncharacterized protein n=1 Tax=Roseospirillum parvum TaxID=83401 RepID=A0A1G8ANL4_9PROT|nr:hypothetical protein [Roseospirillum parvum]SDH22548.1 hypothetical protein SAMN05421742_10556 [Roseospirillum parvum]